MNLAKKIISLLMVATVISVCIVTAIASEQDTQDTGFSDVSARAWYAEPVKYVNENGIMRGTTDTTFEPSTPMSREMLAAVLYRTEGSPGVSGIDVFKDTEDSAWYSDAVLWASQNNIINGYGNGLFGVNDYVSREQIATIFWLYAGSPSSRGNDAGFTDSTAISDWASEAVDWAKESGIINGKERNRFDPSGNATRAEVAAVLHNYLISKNYVPDKANEHIVKRTLIAYFGRMGNTNYPVDVDATSSASLVAGNDNRLQGTTEVIANLIAERTSGDLHLIQTEQSYPADYDAVVAQNRKEQQEDYIPELKNTIENMDQYDIIFIGYPVWATTAPQAIKSFLSEYDLSGKTVIPFCTHAGYGSGRSYGDIADLIPGSDVLKGLDVEADQVDTASRSVEEWLKELNIAATGNKQQSAEKSNIIILIGTSEISAVLNDSAAAQEFKSMLPTTLSMTRMEEHEYYGSLEQNLTHESDLQTGYTVGDLAFWTPGNLFALYFDEPDKDPKGLMILGRITTDLSVFDNLGNKENVYIKISE